MKQTESEQASSSCVLVHVPLYIYLTCLSRPVGVVLSFSESACLLLCVSMSVNAYRSMSLSASLSAWMMERLFGPKVETTVGSKVVCLAFLLAPPTGPGPTPGPYGRDTDPPPTPFPGSSSGAR